MRLAQVLCGERKEFFIRASDGDSAMYCLNIDIVLKWADCNDTRVNDG